MSSTSSWQPWQQPAAPKQQQQPGDGSWLPGQQPRDLPAASAAGGDGSTHHNNLYCYAQQLACLGGVLISPPRSEQCLQLCRGLAGGWGKGGGSSILSTAGLATKQGQALMELQRASRTCGFVCVSEGFLALDVSLAWQPSDRRHEAVAV